MLNKFFPIVDTCLSCEDIARQIVRWCPDGDFLGPAFPASRAHHISDMHSKFTLEPHHVWKYMVDIQSATAEIRRGKKKKERKKKKPQDENIMSASATQGGHNNILICHIIMLL